MLTEWAGEDIGAAGSQAILDFAAEHARRERDSGLPAPSHWWRRTIGIGIGVMRMIASDPVHLADGTILAEHQTEVLESTAAALVESYRASQGIDATDHDPGRYWRYWFEHATGSGKTVAACALIDAAATCGVLVLCPRRVLVEQFQQEITARGYGDRLRDLRDLDDPDSRNGVFVATYQWFTRNFDTIDPERIEMILCDEAHQTLGAQTTEALRSFDEAVIIGMTATGALIGKSVQELFPKQVSLLDLRRAAEIGVIAPLRALRMQPPVPIDQLAAARRTGGDFDAQELSQILNRDPFNYAAAQLYRDTFGGLPGIVYAAGIDHAERLQAAFVSAGVPAVAVSGRTPRAELDQVLKDFDAGRMRVLINAQLLMEGWNSPRVTVCMHLAPTASERVYLQRTGRVTRRAEDKEAGWVVDFVPPSYPHNGPIVTIHGLLDLDTYRAGERVTEPGPTIITPAPASVAIAAPVSAVLASRSSRRAGLIADQWLDLRPSELAPDDQLAWAKVAGRGATTPGLLNELHGRCEGLDPRVGVALLRFAAQGPFQAVRERAAATLWAQRSAQAFKAAAEVALASITPREARDWTMAAITMAADGAPADLGVVVGLARAEHGMFEQSLRADSTLRKLLDRGRGAALLQVAEAASDEVCAGLIACATAASEDQVRQTAGRRFSSGGALARALQAVSALAS